MLKHNRVRRFWTGFGLVLVVLAAGFSIANWIIPDWGIDPSEKGMVLPGDEIFQKPVMKWEHAVTIAASPEQVWPWVIQMGDTRGGYYSYRLIEKAVTAAAGIDVSTYYNNLNAVAPQWQNPPIGQGMIMDVLVLRAYQPVQYMVAGPKPEQSEAGLLWTWALIPTPDGKTRLLVHLSIQIPGAEGNQAIATATNLATFMMEKKMMDGIKLRIEGGSEADWVQVAEALIWFSVFGTGLAAARRFIIQPNWIIPLAVGLGAVVLLFILVYIQPDLWLRAAGLFLLIGGLVWDSKRLGAKPVLQ